MCEPLEVYVTVLPRKGLVYKRKGETAINVPRGMNTPQLQQLVVQRNRRMHVLDVRFRLQTSTTIAADIITITHTYSTSL